MATNIPIQSPTSLSGHLFSASIGVAVWLLLTAASTCDAFGPTGHRIVGQIASNHLSPQAKQSTQQILGSESLAEAATWADEIRSNPDFHRGPWHYVTIEDGETFQTSHQDPLEGNVVDAIRLNEAVLRDPHATKENKVIALRWLIHLVGDVHQPLHVGRGDDLGGNKIKVVWFGEETNIHVVWDEGLIESTKLSFSELARFLDVVTPETIAQWQNSTVLDWVRESVSYRSRVYELPAPPAYPGDKSGSYQYASKNVPLVKQRMLQAGVRLAGRLNEIFSDELRDAAAVSQVVETAATAEATAEIGDDNPVIAALGGTLWTQTGEEYRAVSISAYRQAKRMLRRALNDKTWTALPGKEPRSPAQAAALAALPPAIILDVDETVLDNSPYQAWLIKENKTFGSISWNRWVASQRAKAIPGAVEFVDKARKMGVTIFFVTNRDYQGKLDENSNGVIDSTEGVQVLEPFTIANLREVGLLPQEGISDEDSVLLKDESDDWTSDKTTRRQLIAQSYRVLMLIGDSLGDFASYKSNDQDRNFYDLDQQQRQQELLKHRSRWAKSWIILPNAVYGSWLAGNSAARLQSLDAWDGSR